MSDSILYKVRSGKPIKFWYFIRKYMGLVIPDFWYRIRLEQRLCRVSSRPDYPYIQERVNYYIQQDRTRPIPSEKAGLSPKLAALYGTYRPIPE